MSALGSMFYGREPAQAVLKEVSPEDFLVPAHRTLAAALKGLSDSDMPIDLVTTKLWLEAYEQLESVGGEDYLIKVAEFVPSPASGAHYAQIVANYAALRSLEEAAVKIGKLTRDPDGDPLAKVEEAESLLRDVRVRLNGHASLDVRDYSTLAAKQIDWLWYPYLAEGATSLVVGDPGIGKSTFAYALTSAITKGEGPPGFKPRPPADVFLACLEDDPERVIVPQLDRGGADRSRIHDIPKLRPPMTAAKMRAVVETVRRYPETRLVVFDPISEWFPPDRSMNTPNEARDVLQLFRQLAEDCRICTLILGHPNKSVASSLIHRVSGSIDFAAIVRSILFATKIPGTDDLALLHVKTNWGARGKAIGYAIDETGLLSWTGAQEVTEEQIHQTNREQPVTNRQRDEAKAWLEQTLAEGPLASDEVFAGGKAAGFSKATLFRAKELADITCRKWGGSWQWALNSNGHPANFRTPYADDPFDEE